MKSGKVIFIGASLALLFPERSERKLQEADVIICDRLIDPQILIEIDESKIIYAGKSIGDNGSQQDINRMMVEFARAGKTVVRLKGGDPLIFARGGEEIEMLSGTGINFEIIPGITAANIASAYSGIPLTHREYASTLAFATGHRRLSGATSNSMDFTALARLDTIVLYMSVAMLRENIAALIQAGLKKDKPVAVIERAGTGLQRSITGTAETIADVIERQNPPIRPPAIVIIGDVVRLKEKNEWFKTKPLFGQTVIITRPACRTGTFYDTLTELGAYVLSIPAIEYEDLKDFSSLDNTLFDVADGKYDWLVLTSQKSVEVMFQRLQYLRIDIRSLNNVKIAVVGDITAKALEQCFVHPDIVPEKFTTRCLGEALIRKGISDKNIVLLRTDVEEDNLYQMLQDGGANVEKVVSYNIRLKQNINPLVFEHLNNVLQVDWITFTSASTVKGFFSLVERYGLEPKIANAKLISIGPATTNQLIRMDKDVFAESDTHTEQGLIDTITLQCTDFRSK